MIQDVFGSEFIDSSGAMDRAKMRERVFSDGTAKRQLEGILHPMIRAASIAAIAGAKSPYVVNVVPLLFESGRWQDKVSRTLVVDCPEEIQVARVMSRSGLDRKAVLAIMNQQVTRKERLALADDIIDNSGAPESVEAPVTRLHAQYQELAR
jgi:dephospho-CoA kinase